MKLTAAQREALEVICKSDKPVRCSKRSTSTEPFPCVNTKAALSLAEKKLVRCHMPVHWSPYTSDYTFTPTEAGRELLGGVS